MYDARTQKVVDSRQRCPVCDGESRIFNCLLPEWHYEIRCKDCGSVWKLVTKPETVRGKLQYSGANVRKAIREWNAIAIMERKSRREAKEREENAAD